MTTSQPAVSIVAAPGHLGQLPAMLESVRAKSSNSDG